MTTTVQAGITVLMRSKKPNHRLAVSSVLLARKTLILSKRSARRSSSLAGSGSLQDPGREVEGPKLASSLSRWQFSRANLKVKRNDYRGRECLHFLRISMPVAEKGWAIRAGTKYSASSKRRFLLRAFLLEGMAPLLQKCREFAWRHRIPSK